MTKIIFIISACILTCSVHAQVEQTNSVKDTVNGKEDKQIDKPNSNQISTDTEVIFEKLEQCYYEKKELKDSLVNVNKVLMQTKVDLNNTRDSLNRELSKKSKELNSVKDKNKLLEKNTESYDNLLKVLKEMDAIVYRQCLLYPLERQYDKDFVNETLNAADGFKRLGDTVVSEDFLKYYKTYIHLIDDYKKYNDELLEYFKKFKNSMRDYSWELSPTLKDVWKGYLEKLQYYKYYENRKDEPYESILYLDDIIEEFENRILKQDNVKNLEKEINDLIDKLYDENANKTKS